MRLFVIHGSQPDVAPSIVVIPDGPPSPVLRDIIQRCIRASLPSYAADLNSSNSQVGNLPFSTRSDSNSNGNGNGNGSSSNDNHSNNSDGNSSRGGENKDGAGESSVGISSILQVDGEQQVIMPPPSASLSIPGAESMRRKDGTAFGEEEEDVLAVASTVAALSGSGEHGREDDADEVGEDAEEEEEGCLYVLKQDRLFRVDAPQHLRDDDVVYVLPVPPDVVKSTPSLSIAALAQVAAASAKRRSSFFSVQKGKNAAGVASGKRIPQMPMLLSPSSADNPSGTASSLSGTSTSELDESGKSYSGSNSDIGLQNSSSSSFSSGSDDNNRPQSHSHQQHASQHSHSHSHSLSHSQQQGLLGKRSKLKQADSRHSHVHSASGKRDRDREKDSRRDRERDANEKRKRRELNKNKRTGVQYNDDDDDDDDDDDKADVVEQPQPQDRENSDTAERGKGSGKRMRQSVSSLITASANSLRDPSVPAETPTSAVAPAPTPVPTPAPVAAVAPRGKRCRSTWDKIVLHVKGYNAANAIDESRLASYTTSYSGSVPYSTWWDGERLFRLFQQDPDAPLKFPKVSEALRVANERGVGANNSSNAGNSINSNSNSSTQQQATSGMSSMMGVMSGSSVGGYSHSSQMNNFPIPSFWSSHNPTLPHPHSHMGRSSNVGGFQQHPSQHSSYYSSSFGPIQSGFNPASSISQISGISTSQNVHSASSSSVSSSSSSSSSTTAGSSSSGPQPSSSSSGSLIMRGHR
eukprot:ANDGO_02825.mRNA.1 hypothetical protein